ncbi:hypothetical protein CAPTEDRAFT_6413 [Capitella teleta]|uniref:Protein SDA1 n=1 Tax=Capitella teleta TaxID=283909 RepID=R7T4X4_CAPTE|nr:hypothetical protein CAPTEDRAFT_6413 [Capitella teleta]|eukprot:ELT88157.1 hypothetical protein CAPTEDRAFT_6413 [Capitella teleta]
MSQTDKHNNQLPDNLPQLQNLIKRDPESYKDEFLQQYRHYQSTLQVFQLKPSSQNETLTKLVVFLAQVSSCYPEELANFPQELREMLQQHATTIQPAMRMHLCQALILLRNRGLMSPTSLLELFFQMFRCQDKVLRKTLYNYIVQDIKNVNQKHRNMKLNVTLQNFMFTMLRDSNATAAKMSLDVMIELYRRNIWKDAKTVNVIVTALFSKVTKILMGALQFFLGVDEDTADDESSSEDEGAKSQKDILLAHRVGKKTKKRQKTMDKALTALKKHKKKRKPAAFNFSAIHLINDPQDLSEKLFKVLEKSNERFEVKLCMMNLISRLVGIHKLFLFNFYPFIQRFLQPHQRDVTKILLFSAQSSHDLVPPDILQSVVRTIADNFITERNSSEVMAVGLNAVREICARCPLAMTEDLLRDFALYKSSKQKSVVMASRSLIHLYRDKHLELLHKKDRGKPTEAQKEVKPLQYGEIDAKMYLPGAEILKTKEQMAEAALEQDGWESASEEEDNDSDGSWVDVHHSSDEGEGQKLEAEAGITAMDEEDKVKRAEEITQSRILSQDDFQKIRIRQISKTMGADHRKEKRRAKVEEAPHESGEIIPLDDIEKIHKKRRHDYDSRLETVLEGRKDRPKYGVRDKRMDPHASTTNKEKSKKKNFTMLKHKFKKKHTKRSFSEKKEALKSSLLKKMKRRK